MTTSKKRKDQLGAPHGTAMNRLRKSILFELVQRAALNTCYRCGELITSASDLTLDHKVPWMDTDDPQGLFFDTGNVAFSHLKCNVAAGRRSRKLSSKAVEHVRRSNETSSVLAEEYNVSPSTIRSIRQGKTYKT